MPDRAGSKRRLLSFDELSEIMPDVQRVKASHRTFGRWTLGQICVHLAASFNGSIDGLDLRRHRFKRFFFARLLLWYTFRYGIPVDYQVDPGIEPESDVNLDEAVDELSRAIRRYQDHRGSLAAHPLFTRMSRENWYRLHRIHCAHHLSFVLPEGA